ncbi:MAG: hypothetical protein EBY83_05690, partial [Verrucomicrobia bacterium]|nr:hypothetical protein [Verrucomicrobiota bacterium]
MQTPSPAPIEYVSNLKRALIYGQINEKDFYPFSPIPSSRSFLSSTVKGTEAIIDQTYRAWNYGQMSSAIVQNPNLLSRNDAFGGPAPADFVDDLRRSLLYGGLTYTDLGGFYIPPYQATFWRDFTKFQTLNHGTGIPLTCTRSGSASYIGSDGQMKIAQVNEPRFDFDPVTLECKGLLCEVSRKNFVLNSAVGQTQAPFALVGGTYTVSWYGTGTVVVLDSTGSNIGTMVGSGAFPIRTNFSVTVVTGNYSLLVAGSVQYLQFESGTFPTSWIPTGATPSVNDTRAQDFIESSSDGLPSSIFDYAEGTLYASFQQYANSQRAGFLDFKADQINTFSLRTQTGTNTADHEFNKRPGNRGLETVCRNLTNSTVGTVYKLAGAYNNNTSDYRLF